MGLKVLLLPKFRGEDKGDGGIRRVVEAQHKYLPFEFVETEPEADIVALHAGMWVETQKPVVAHCHGLYWKEYEWPLWCKKLNHEVADNIRRADIVTAPSEWVANALRRAFLVDPIVLHHGVDPIDPGENQGYVLWNKTRADNVCLVDEVEELARRASDVQFVSTFGHASKNLTVVGRQTYEDGIRTLQGAAVYLGTTKETFGVGILEAMMCGVPVLSWDWGGQSEVIKHKETGYLVRPGDFDELLKGLYYCVEHRDKLGNDAREFVLEYYSWEKRIQPYVALYEHAKRAYKKGVSVIIPCYNYGKYLAQAVDSCAGKVDEVIVVDDASTDDSRAVALEQVLRTDVSVKLLVNEENIHVAASRNKAIAEAKYEYILPLDADDYLHNVEALRVALDKDRSLDIAYGAVQFVDEANVPVQAVGPNGVSDWPFDFKFRGIHVFPYSYCPITSMYRHTAFDRVGGYRERYKGVEDADIYSRLLSIGCKAQKVTDDVTFVYRMKTDSLSHTEKKVDWTLWYQNHPAIPPDNSDIQIPSYDPTIVSVVIPVGPGHERLLLDALDSLWAQTYEKWECIVVNDTGRPSLWAPSWAKVISTGGRKGPARARNAGIEASKGRYVYFLDADDYMQLDALEKLLDGQRKFGGFVYSDWFEHETGRVHESVDCVCEENLRELLTAINILYPVSAGITFDENLKGWEDWDFVLQLAEKGLQGNRVAKPLFSYRIHAGSRREALYSQREELKKEMYDKWGSYIRGEKKLACGACGQKPRAVTVNQTVNVPNISSDGMVLVEYIGASAGTRPYTGRATGTKYRFGNDPDHRVKKVYKEDLPSLVSLSDLREYVPGESAKQLVTS